MFRPGEVPVHVIRAPRVVADSVPLGPACVAVSDGVILGVAAGETYGDVSPDVDLPSGVLIPGLVDMQINGCFGVDFVAADAAGWAEVSARLPETGVTSFVPTFITAPIPDLVGALRRTAALPADLGGARVLGVHVEGPFLAPNRHGAHDPALLRDPTPEAVDALIDAAPGLLRMHTLAPERPGALAAVRRLVEAGILVSVGHSDATAEQTEAAADAGARLVTHLFNAMRPLHHREPGVVGQGLADPRLTCGLIADLHHVAAPVCRLAFAAAPSRIVLVTDAVAAAGMPPGTYDLGGQQVSVDPLGLPRRSDGTIAGSGLRLDAAIANVVAAGVDLRSAVEAASRLPADILGRPDLGRIEPGASADLVWLGDDLSARATWLAGRLAFGRLPGTVDGAAAASPAADRVLP
ncbi:MAG TPA: N-acetylglucosamine-6-phosphate deacetylase [Mycobacteriales bacterium]